MYIATQSSQVNSITMTSEIQADLLIPEICIVAMVVELLEI